MLAASSLHLQGHPARDLDAVARRELGDLGVVVDRHDAGHDGHVDAQRAHLVHEVEVGVRVEEELRDGRAGASPDLVGEVLQVAPRVPLFRMVFRVGRHLDVPVRALGFAHKPDQVGSVSEFTRHRRAAGQVTAQGHQPADALGTVGVEDLGDALARGAHARQVRCCLVAGRGDVAHGGQRLVARGAAGAVGHAEELGPHGRQVLHDGLQLVAADRRVGREELEADGDVSHGVVPDKHADESCR
jgi:hypothetical protein